MLAIKTPMGRPKKAETTVPVRVPASVARRAKRIAAHLEKDLGDWLAEVLGPVLDRAEAKMLAEIGKEREAASE